MMKPYEMPCDMFTFSPSVSAHESGLRRTAPLQHDDWSLEPFYGLGKSVIMDIKEERLLTNNRIPIPNKLFSPLLMKSVRERVAKGVLSGGWPKDIQYLHVMRFWGSALGVCDRMSQAILIADMIVPNIPYIDRRRLLEEQFPQLGIRRNPQIDTPHIVPRFEVGEAFDLWSALHLVNQLVPHDEIPFHGIIEKRHSAPYYFQDEGSYVRSLSWINHPFTDLQ